MLVWTLDAFSSGIGIVLAPHIESEDVDTAGMRICLGDSPCHVADGLQFFQPHLQSNNPFYRYT